MRLLHRRHDHARASVAGKESIAVGSRDSPAHDAQSLPLRHPHAHSPRRAPRSRAHARCGDARRETVRFMINGERFGFAVSRRGFLAASGALVVSFSLLPVARLLAQQAPAAKPPGSLGNTPMLDAWIRIGAEGGVTVFTGKAELGQGIKTALIQIAAEQLGVQPARINLITADTSRTPDEGFTAGSRSMQDSGTAIMNAAAQVREILLARAAERLAIPVERLQAQDGAVVADDGRRIAFGELVSDDLARVRAQPQSKLKDPQSYTVMGKPFARIDIPAKVTGGLAYVQDLRLPGMAHARVVRPPGYGARLRDAAIDDV